MTLRPSPFSAILPAFCFSLLAAFSVRAQDEADVPAVEKQDRLLFMSNREGGEAFHIYAMKADGTEVQRVGKSELMQFDAAASPDGKRIAYSEFARKEGVDEANKSAIYVMNADGSDPVKLTDLKDAAIGPQWSPDGKRIAFFAFSEELEGMTLYVMNANGKELKKLADGGFPAWSPDGGKLLFSKMDGGNREPKISVLDLKSGEAEELSDAKMMMASYSPDGKQVVYMGEGGGDQADIFVADADFQNPKHLTKTEAIELGPQWSPDGRTVFFSRMAKDAPPGPDSAIDIFALDVKSGEERQLTKDKGINAIGGGGFMLMMFVSDSRVAPEPEKKG